MLESKKKVRYLNQQTDNKKKPMKTVKFQTVKKQIQEGRIECVTDLRIGFVEVLNLVSRKRMFIKVV